MTDTIASNTTQQRPDELRACAAALVQHLRAQVLPEPGRRATVRAALGQQPGSPRTFRAYREISTFLPRQPKPWQERAFFEVAAMLCAQPASNRHQEITAADPSNDTSTSADAGTRDQRSLGNSCAQAVNRSRVAERSMEDRLHQICRGDAAGAYRQLPRLVHQLRGVGADIDWIELIEDLARWDVARDDIAARWLRGFYRGLTARSATQDPHADDTSQEDPS